MMKQIKITREWAMPSKRTFEIKPIKRLIEKYHFGSVVTLDPFPFNYKEDAIIYLNNRNDNQYLFALFDPPYSPRQLKECYNNQGEYDTKSSTWSNWKDLISKKIKVGGIIISFGWNSNGMGKERGFEIIEILLVSHGGMHNDTICVVEKKLHNNLKINNRRINDTTN